MKEFSRRDFLKLAGYVTASAMAMPRIDVSRLNAQVPESESKFMPAFEFIGPPIIDTDNRVKDFGEGERSGWVDPNDSDRILVGTGLHGLLKTVNGGRCWEKVNVPVVEQGEEPSIARDMLTIPGTKDLLVVFDFSLAIGSLDNPNWDIIPLPNNRRVEWIAQTADVLPDGRIIIGGDRFPGAVAIANIKTLKETVEFNKKNPNSTKNFDWKLINGLFEKESNGLIRTITHTPGRIFLGGWIGIDSHGKNPGTGLICIDDQSFKKIEKYSFPLEDGKGPMSINTIKVTNYKGHEIIFVGGEGPHNREYVSNMPSLQIIVDGKIHPLDLVNNKGLAKSGGGWNIITPQRGIVVCPETSEVFISSAFGEISRAGLDDIVDGKLINWERITKAPIGQKDTGALHLILTHRKRSRIPALVMCREIYGNGSLPFQQVGIADLASEHRPIHVLDNFD